MTDISGVLPFGGGGFAVRPPVASEAPAVPEVQPSEASSNRTDQFLPRKAAAQQNSARTADVEPPSGAATGTATPQPEQSDWRDKRAEDIRVGPTPAFDASLLEVERDLRTAIARVEAARTAERDAPAIRPEAAPEAAEAAGPEPREEPRPAPAPETNPDAAKEGPGYSLETPYDVEASALAQQ